jgi:hypothetical protein
VPSRSSSERSLISAIGAHERAARYDGREVTANARSAFLTKFLREVDEASPGLPEGERQRRAGHLLQAHMRRLALASSKARARKAAR